MTVLHPGFGFDCSTPTTPVIARVTTSGVEFVGRYLWKPGKGIDAVEARALTSIGVKILSFYEAQGDRASGFSAAQGATDAKAAAEWAAKIGQPEGSAIYFGYDYDATPADESYRLLPYGEAARKVLDGRYRFAGYGSGLTGEALFAAGLTDLFVLGAIGWRDGHAFLPRATVVQKPPSDPYHFGIEVDPDIAQVTDLVANAGMWSLGPVPPIPAPLPPVHGRVLRLASPMLYGDDVRVAEGALRRLGLYRGAIDGWFGTGCAAAVRAFKTTHKLSPVDDVVDDPTLAALLSAK